MRCLIKGRWAGEVRCFTPLLCLPTARPCALPQTHHPASSLPSSYAFFTLPCHTHTRQGEWAEGVSPGYVAGSAIAGHTGVMRGEDEAK